jgi:SAM-dependent methyltransferase
MTDGAGSESLSQERIRLPRRKPRRLGISFAYRSYRVIRRLVPRRPFARFLLASSWLLDRLAWEQTLFLLGSRGGFNVLRPHTRGFIHDQVRPADRVMDIGGGRGVFTREMAALASEVVYADLDPANLRAARLECEGLPNVHFVLGDGLAESRRRAPFQLGFLLHVLEHLDEPVSALTDLRECCERLAIEVPDIEAMPHLHIRRSLNAPYYWDDDHVSEFSANSLQGCLAAAGWTAISVWKANGCLLASATR